MSNMNEIVKTLQDAVTRQTNQAKPTAYDTPAVVRRVEGDTAWVHIPDGVDETPVKMTINAKEGDQVQVRVSGGSAFMVGNGTAPPTDDAKAKQAYTIATVAEGAAENALANANLAKEAADSAQASASAAESAAGDAVIAAGDAQTAAGNAQQSADSALVNLSTVQDVVGVLNWITAHGTMTLTSDVAVNPAHVYFVVDAGGDYVVGGTHYSIVSEPKDAELSTYYELTVDESVQNYVATHIVVDSEGLWIVPDAGGNKVLIATGAGSTYTTAGTYIVGKVGGVDTVLAKFLGTGVVIGQENGAHTTINSSGQKVYANDGTTQVVDLGYGPGKSQSGGTADAPYFTLGHRSVNSAIGNYSSAEGYNIVASGYASHAEGYTDPHYGAITIASGKGAHAEGHGTVASGDFSHAEGYGDEYASTEASGTQSHAEGYKTTASGAGSHAEGEETTASGRGAHAEGFETIAQRRAQTVIGKCNVTDTSGDYTDSFGKYAFIIGNGANENARSNALTVDWSGNVMAQGFAGMIQMFAGSTAPAGWLICDGSAVSRTTYATLFAVIGTTYGAGDGSTTFNLPDLRGRVPVGAGTGTASDATTHSLGQKAGEETHTLSIDEMPSHTHDIAGALSVGGQDLAVYGNARVGTGYNVALARGGGQAHNNMQPYLAINYIIATGKTS